MLLSRANNVLDQHHTMLALTRPPSTTKNCSNTAQSVAFLTQHMTPPPSIPGLATISGLNHGTHPTIAQSVTDLLYAAPMVNSCKLQLPTASHFHSSQRNPLIVTSLAKLIYCSALLENSVTMECASCLTSTTSGSAPLTLITPSSPATATLPPSYI